MDLAILAVLLGPAASCVGVVEPTPDEDVGNRGNGRSGGGDDVVPPEAKVFPARELAATVGLRRLTGEEYDNTLRDLLGHRSATPASSLLPADLRGPRLPGAPWSPFDDYQEQQKQISDSLVQSLEVVAREVASSLVQDAARRDQVVGCTSTNPKCLADFVARFGRRALRRPLTPDEVKVALELPVAAAASTSFDTSVELIVRAFLQHPELIHRVEIGTPTGVPGLFKLGSWEMASRLSYFLLGTMPTEALMKRAEAGGLTTAADVRAAAAEVLADPGARERAARFHAMWLGHERIPHSLGEDMKKETKALLDRVIFDEAKQKPWQDLFRSTETFVTGPLAKNYGLRMPQGFSEKTTRPQWVPYAGTSRRGLLSHGAFLSLGNKFGDTSPIVRGKEIQERLLCRTILPPPPTVKADAPPMESTSLCKWDRYLAHRQSPACAGCHNQLDPVGFGLETFDAFGRYRTTQYWTKDVDGKPTAVAPGTAGAERCALTQPGEIDSHAFNGPGPLADVLLATPAFNECALTQLYRFATSRLDLDGTDKELIGLFKKQVGNRDFRFDEVLLDLVSSPAFMHRRVDTGAN